MKTAIAIRHVEFEHLGTIEGVLRTFDYGVKIMDAGVDPLWLVDPVRVDLVIVLGGPIGAYEKRKFPFLEDEFDLLAERLAAGRPTLGICLGAQMLAQILGSRVYPAESKEIGWSTLTLTEEGRKTALAHLSDVAVLHWHGDTFDLPAGANLLASTEKCRNQAFGVGKHVLGLQFHAEVDSRQFERWLIGHAHEIAAANVDIGLLRSNAEAFGEPLRTAAKRLFEDWISKLDSSTELEVPLGKVPP